MVITVPAQDQVQQPNPFSNSIPSEFDPNRIRVRIPSYNRLPVQNEARRYQDNDSVAYLEFPTSIVFSIRTSSIEPIRLVTDSVDPMRIEARFSDSDRRPESGPEMVPDRNPTFQAQRGNGRTGHKKLYDHKAKSGTTPVRPCWKHFETKNCPGPPAYRFDHSYPAMQQLMRKRCSRLSIRPSCHSNC